MMPKSARKLNYENLSHGLELKLASVGADETASCSLLTAATWFEKNAQDHPANAVEDRYLAALGYYLAGHYAQAYVLFRNTNSLPDPRTAYSLLRRLFVKELDEIAADNAAILARGEYTDSGITGDLTSGMIAEGDAVERALIASMHAAFGDVCAYVRSGDPVRIDRALGLIDTCYRIASEAPFLHATAYPALLQGATAMLRELRDNSLWTRLDEMRSADRTGLVQRYIELAVRRSPPLVELWPSQVIPIPKINEGDVRSRPNFLVKMPTSAGKTNIAELSILRFLIDSPPQMGKKCVYIAPFHALGAQVEARLQRDFLPLGVGVSDLYGGFEVSPADPFLFNQQRILVATPEKVDALLRFNSDFASQIGLIFIDEGHLIEDSERGLRFEMLIHRLVRRYANGGARLILASAVMGQADSLVHWITGATDADGLQTSHFRPTRNYLGLLSWNGQVATRELTHVSDESTGSYKSYRALPDVRVRALPDVSLQMSWLPRDRSGFPSNNSKCEPVALAALREARDGMTLVYVPRVDWLESLAKAVFDALEHITKCRERQLPVDVYELQKPVLNEADQLRLDQCMELADELTGADSLVTRALRTGFAVHYRGVPERLRNLLAPLIEQGVFSLVIATSTIIHGVNTPAKTVLIHSLVRGDQGDWTHEISSREFLNLVGRAGRAMQETEGTALLFTDADAKKSARARRSIRQFVARINADELKSALRTFLYRVADQWRKHHPGADVGDLCVALADDRIDWLDINARDQLDEVDRELLALIQELQESDTAPATVEDLFARSLVALQSSGDADSWHSQQTSLSLLAARIEHLQKIPAPVRRAYYRSGLPLADCKVLEKSAEALLARFGTFGQIPNYSAEQIAGIIWGLYRDFLSDLSIFRKKKGSPPACAERILRGWLDGLRVDAIADLPEVKAAALARSDVTAFIDDFCSSRMPWALNAVRGYFSAIAPNKIADDWLSMWSAMVHFGLPSPKAAMFYALGLRSREAAVCCAGNCTEPAQSPELHQWLINLPDDEIGQWQVTDRIRQEIVTFRDNLKLSGLDCRTLLA